MNPRPEIVLPPGFSLRIDYDPAQSPASLLVTAFQDDTPVGQAHLNPREVGLRLRLEVEGGEEPAAAEAMPRARKLRLTPRNASLAIEMQAVDPSAPLVDRVVPPPETPSVELHAPSSVVWLEDGTGVVLPSSDVPREETGGGGVRESLRALGERAVELLALPFSLRVLDPQRWVSWRAAWHEIPPPVAGDV